MLQWVRRPVSQPTSRPDAPVVRSPASQPTNSCDVTRGAHAAGYPAMPRLPEPAMNGHTANGGNTNLAASGSDGHANGASAINAFPVATPMQQRVSIVSGNASHTSPLRASELPMDYPLDAEVDALQAQIARNAAEFGIPLAPLPTALPVTSRSSGQAMDLYAQAHRAMVSPGSTPNYGMSPARSFFSGSGFSSPVGSPLQSFSGSPGRSPPARPASSPRLSNPFILPPSVVVAGVRSPPPSRGGSIVQMISL